MRPELEILVCTIPERGILLTGLLGELNRQIQASSLKDSARIMVNSNAGNIGLKRNALLFNSTAKYIAFFDDDDHPEDKYIPTLEAGIKADMDCIALKGLMTTNGMNPETFHHSLNYSVWKTNERGPIKYERTINHLNCVKSKFAKRVKFPETNFGEDHAWSKRLHALGLLKTEWPCDEVIYHYRYLSHK